MIRYEIEKLVEKAGNRYSLVIGTAKRARQIKDYLNAITRQEMPQVVPPQVDLEEMLQGKPISIALKELLEGKLEIIEDGTEAEKSK